MHFTIYFDGIFQLPLSIETHEEFHALSDEINDITPSNEPNKWQFQWSNDYYSTKKVYLALIGNHVVPAPILDIWKTCNIPRQNFFCVATT